MQTKQENGAFRTEKDSMGEVAVPAEALYGAQTQRAVNNFTIAPRPMPWPFIEAVLYIKRAAAVANRQLGVLSVPQSRAIEDAIAKLLAEKPFEQFPVPVLQTGSGTSTNMNVNEVIAGLARLSGVELSPNDHVNSGQSSNDVIPSAVHLAGCRSTVNRLLPALERLAATIRDKASAWHHVVKTGRTHLMDALPIRFSAELEAWGVQLDESRERLTDSLERLQRLPLGGTAVGSGVNCPQGYVELTIAELNRASGLQLRSAHSFYKGLASLDTVVEFSGQLKSCAMALYKIANDLRWMNSGPLAGIGEIRLPALQPGSSIMPAKVNPVIPEAVCMAMAQVVGLDSAIALAATGGSFQLNTMLPLAGANLLEMIELLAGSCENLGDKAIAGMDVNEESCRENLARNPILVTALNPYTGYLKAAEIGKTAQKENRPIIDVASELTDLSKEELEQLLDPQKLADGGDKDRGMDGNG